ncbi:MAG: DUF1998 domain-containing protein [Bacilli bacterium]|nr:DUF1998 domain-containing protein [Bacilli bacterium]
MGSDKKMHRGLQQALYKYLPGNWVDFTERGGSVTYAVHVDNWNSVQLVGINNKRLLRIVNQQINAYKKQNGANSVVGFPSVINDESVDVLIPKISDTIAAIQTSVKPWVFVCNKCGKVKQYYSYDEFKRNENERCECGEHFTQLRMIRVCKCGYADGVFVPKCKNSEHGTKFMIRKGSGLEFVCQKCGQRASMPHYCPECKQELKIKPALDSANYIAFSLSLIDLLDKQKDVFMDTEIECRGEKIIIAQYLDLISQEEYQRVIKAGRIIQDEEFENELKAEAQMYRNSGFDENLISMVLDTKRKNNPNNKILEAVEKVSAGISVVSSDDLKLIAEEILEYGELIGAQITLTIDNAEKDAELVNDGIKPDYKSICHQLGFSNAQLCSAVPIVFSSYGYTRLAQSGEGVKLHGFPQEMSKRNIYATRLETEGVLFELDRERVLNWLVANELIDKNDMPTDTSANGIKMWFLDRVRPNLILPFSEIDGTGDSGNITKQVYTLLHSISHALINEASEICGLDKSSLSEYILPNIPAVFIYCSNSQGFNMGALYSAFQTQFDKWLKRAAEHVKKCIFDPVCINNEKACAGCLYLNEVSCRHFNKDLNRSYLCGYYDSTRQKKLKGYWEI